MMFVIGIFLLNIQTVLANSDTGIDCIEKYSQGIVSMIDQGGESKDIFEYRRVRALIREAYQKIPMLGSEQEEEEEDQETRSAFRMRKGREKKKRKLNKDFL